MCWQLRDTAELSIGAHALSTPIITAGPALLLHFADAKARQSRE